MWCEAAVDGLIWYDADGGLTSRLADVRRAIAAGRVVRGSAHGQPYWKGAAWCAIAIWRPTIFDELRPGCGRPTCFSSWADVVRESQEIVELALKGLLRANGVEPPRIHHVADVLVAERNRLPAELAPRVDRLAAVSRALRRDRELAFYGAEDLTPSTFYREADAVLARDSARDVVADVRPHVADSA